MKVFKLRKTNLLLIYFIIILFLEIVFKLLTNNTLLNISIIYIILFSIFLSLLLTCINTLFTEKINKIIFYVCIFFLCLLFSVEFCVYKMFGFYFDLSLLGAADQVLDFASDGLTLILENILGIMIIFLPFILLITFKKNIVIFKNSWKKELIYLGISVIVFITLVLSFRINKNNGNTAYSLYYEINNIELSLKKFGVVHTFLIDIERHMLGFEEKINISNYDINVDNLTDSEIVYDYNNLEIDFDNLINSASDDTIKQMHEYFKNEKGSLQNEYTKYFEGKNLILFMAESFNEIAVDKKRTPTLYKLINNGFIFNDFYTPTISSTIGGEFQELTGLVAASGFITPWKSGENSFPYGIANSFKKLDYNVYAYHNHNYTFQSRNKYLTSLGFDNFIGCRNGLESKMNCNQWPESDVDMIDVTINDYISSDKPFFTYYVTVSSHGDYGWANSAMARKHKDEVSNLPYSEKVLSYLAANIELDKALELLINKLEEADILDDTVIALVGDHYPYYLSIDEVNEVSSYKKDSVVEVNHSNFILWNNKMENVKVNKVGSQIDVLPTIYNLFGVNYDSRLIIGKDILSTEPGLAIFGNRSWVSDYGTYFSTTDEFVAKDGKIVNENYVNYMNQLVANKVNMSKLILINNYYKYFE